MSGHLPPPDLPFLLFSLGTQSFSEVTESLSKVRGGGPKDWGRQVRPKFTGLERGGTTTTCSLTLGDEKEGCKREHPEGPEGLWYQSGSSETPSKGCRLRQRGRGRTA